MWQSSQKMAEKNAVENYFWIRCKNELSYLKICFKIKYFCDFVEKSDSRKIILSVERKWKITRRIWKKYRGISSKHLGIDISLGKYCLPGWGLGNGIWFGKNRLINSFSLDLYNKIYLQFLSIKISYMSEFLHRFAWNNLWE